MSRKLYGVACLFVWVFLVGVFEVFYLNLRYNAPMDNQKEQTESFNIQRRGLLKFGLAGAALASLGATTLALRPSADMPEMSKSTRIIDAKAFVAIAAIIDALLTDERSIDTSALVYDSDRVFSYVQQQPRSQLLMAIGLLENALSGLFLRGSTTAFSRLSRPNRQAAMVRLRDSRFILLNAIYVALRKLSQSVYYMHLEAFSEIGYQGPRFEKPAAPSVLPNQPLTPIEMDPYRHLYTQPVEAGDAD